MANAQNPVEKELQKIIKKSGIQEDQLGISISLDSKSMMELNAKKKFIPASTTKLVTAGAFLRKFPPASKFKTTLVSNARQQNETLKGDLYLVGAGDPSFVSENMWFLVNTFTRNGIKMIEGNIVVDDSLFDSERFDSSRQKERVDRAYDAPVGAMSFNWNSMNVFVRPGDKEDDPAKVWVDPENEYVKLVNKVKTTKKTTNITAGRDEADKGDMVVVSGTICRDCNEQVVYKNITQPDVWSGYQLKSFLRQRGIEVRGAVKTGGKAPSDARALSESESKPMQDILADMNKFSNNYVAEMLCKNLGALSEKPGTMENGMKELNRYMKTLKVPETEYELYNPSGLTKDNKMSANSLVKVLEDMHKQFQSQPEFTSSLPIAGVDGTLKKRMKSTSAERWVRAKTGYINNVVSLAGYAGQPKGNVFSFVFIYNGSVDESKVRGVFDKMAQALVDVEL